MGILLKQAGMPGRARLCRMATLSPPSLYVNIGAMPGSAFAIARR